MRIQVAQLCFGEVAMKWRRLQHEKENQSLSKSFCTDHWLMQLSDEQWGPSKRNSCDI